MKRLIINADDFGLTGGVTRGIAESILNGLVCSTSAMVCMPGFAENMKPWLSRLQGRIGIHLQLTDGDACSDPASVPSLLENAAHFPRSWRSLGTPRPEEIRREWHAQMKRLVEAGIQPSHLDTHHHVHRFPAIFEVYCEIAQAYRLPARTLSPRMTESLRKKAIASSEFCETGWYGGELTKESLINRLTERFERHGDNCVVELMCHPGFADDELSTKSKYVLEREQELHVLCSNELAGMLNERGIQIVGMSGLLH